MTENLNVNKIIIILIMLFTIYIVNKFIKKILTLFSEMYPEKRIFLKNMIPLVNILLNTLIIFFILFGVLGLKIERFIAFGISAGVAIGFAVQDILSNAFAGFVILFTRPFNVGDKVDVSGYYGEVIDITLLKIRIVTLDDSVVNIPSKNFLSSTVSNANAGELNCQIVTQLHIPANTDLKKIKEIILQAVYSSPYTYLKKPVAVIFKDEFKEMFLTKVIIRSYVFDHRFEGRYSSDIYERIMNYINENNIIHEDFYRLPRKIGFDFFNNPNS